MLTLDELRKEFIYLNYKIKNVLDNSGYTKNKTVKYSTEDPNELFLQDEYLKILGNLQNVKDTLDYLGRIIVGEGYIFKNENGKYQVDGFELSEGSHIEFLYFDNLSNQEKWVSSRIEFIEDEYYLYNYKDVSLENLKVRVRRLEF